MIKVLNRFVLILIAIILFAQLNSYAQNTPTNATHLFSLTEGISAPYRLAINSEGTIYITDINQNNVVKYDKSFNYIGSFNVGVKPAAIAINSSDEIFVGDSETGIIYKLDVGENATVFSTVINSASSMVFDNNDLLYVVDSRLKQVRVLDTDGNYLHSIGTEDFIYPTAITYDPENDRIFVSEHGGLEGGFFGSPDAKVWIYDTNGNNLGEVGSGGIEDGQFMKIQGMAVSRTGTFYVIDQSLSSISIFEENETYLNEFGEYGSIPGKLHLPMDVVFDYQGRTIVSSMSAGSVEVYYINEINPTYEISAVDEVICPGENTDIHVDFTGTSPWTFTYTKNGLNPVTVTNTILDPYIFNVTDTGLYEVTSMYDANFGAVDYTNKVRVSQNPFPTSNIASGDVEICTGDNTDISIDLTGAAPWKINYNDGSTTKAISNIDTSPYILEVNETGTYEVIYVEGAGGCTASSMTGTANINVNTLQASLTDIDTIICEGETVDIPITFTGTAPWTFTYSIDDIDQTPITTSSNPYILTTSLEGLYTITALADLSTSSSCFYGSANINFNALPSSNITSVDVSICEGESTNIIIDLTGTAPWDLTYTVDGINPVTIVGINSNPYLLSVQDSGLYEVSALDDINCTGTSFTGSTQVSINPLPTSNLAIGKETFTIFNGATLNYRVELTGTSPWSFTYTSDGLNPLTINTDTSVYFLALSEDNTYEITTLSDAFCTNTDSKGTIDIWYDTSPTAKITGTDVAICEGEITEIPIELTGTAPWTVTYTRDGLNPAVVSTSTTPFLLQVSESGIYEVSALSDANKSGVYFTGSANITVNPLPVSNLGLNKAICEGNTLTLDAGSYTSFLWNDGSITQTIDVSLAGTYNVNITDINGCQNTDEVNVTVNPLPLVNLGADLAICEGETTILDAGTFSSYLWNNGSTSQTLDISAAGTYNVNITDANTCQNTDEIIVSVNTLPIVDLGTDLAICEGETAILDAGTFSSYLWNDGSTSQTLDISAAGTYNVNITDANACQNTDEIIVSVNTLPIVDLGTDLAICEGQTTILNAGSFASYLWSDGSTSQTLDISTAGTYNVNVTDANACQNADEIIVSVNALPIVNLGVDAAMCEGETVTLDAGSFSSYLWSNGSTNQTITVDTEGNYSVNVTDINTCENSDEMFVSVNPLPISEFTFTENNLEVSFINSSLNANSYIWNFGDSNTSTEINPIYIYQTPGEYYVTLTATNNECGDSTIFQNITVISTGFEDFSIDNKINVYPNPSDGLITIDLTNINQTELILEIYNVAGQRIYYRDVESIQSIEKIDLRNFSKGIYTLNIISKDWTKTRKIILSK